LALPYSAAGATVHAEDARLMQVKQNGHGGRAFDADQSELSAAGYCSLERQVVQSSSQTEPSNLRADDARGGACASARSAVRPSVPEPELGVDYSLTRGALGLAIGSLLLAGCFSLLLVVGRIPGLAEWVSDPQFFKRCLVLHVDLALIVWFFAFAAGLYSLLPGDRASHTAFRTGFAVACGGVLAMIAGTMIPRTAPVLANYVPVIDNAMYVAGVALFFGGLVLCFFNGRLLIEPRERFPLIPALFPGERERRIPSFGESTRFELANTRRTVLPLPGGEGRGEGNGPFRITPDIASGLKTTALAYLVAITTFFVSWLATPRGLDAKAYYELVFWGGGHVLQVANVAAMLAVWLLLLSSLLKGPVLSPRVARVLFAVLLAPHLVALLLTFNGTVAPLYRLGFTRLMQFGIAPVVVVILAICLRRLWRAWRDGVIDRADLRDARFIGFAASAALTVTGFLMGAAIRNSTTMIPAHYHASIGAVTVAYMAVTYLLLKPLGFPLPNLRLQRLIPWQLALFGFGQVIFAIGFGVGGFHGLSRKAYGAEQHIRSLGELIGLGVMGAGGLVAVAGGLLFLALMLCAGQPRVVTGFSKFKLKPLPTA
jgi:hypothetical protein